MMLVKDTVIPYQYEAIHDRIPDAEKSSAVRNFRIAAGLEEGEFHGWVFQDSDVAKWLEAVGFSLHTHPDAELERKADEVIDIVEKAQQPDGYLNTYFTIKEPHKRWTNLAECHELYCAGHMIEAAVAYYQATGKRKLLEVVSRFADYIDTVFGPEPGKLKGYPGHQEIELALVKLYHVTGNEKYLKLGKYFLDERGQAPHYFDKEWEERGQTNFFAEMRTYGKEYAQSHLPVREQKNAEGHAVRAVYMYSGMVDVANETGDKELFDACKRLWDNMINKRMYVTGGIGSLAYGERFTFDYDLPNDLAYAETCASIGLIFLAQRMLRVEADRKYADVMERALYNTVLAGMSLDGTRFFYVNPLEVWPEACDKNHSRHHVKATRQKWFGCACCPPNVARLLSSLGEYIYSANSDTVYVHLYIGGEADLDLGGRKVKLVQETQYPTENKTTIKVALEQEHEFTLALRIPGWCPGAELKVNGERIAIEDVQDDGYAKIKRNWQVGDTVELEMEMPVQRIKAHPLVRENAGKVALQKGPFVYCLEEADNGASLHEIVLPKDALLNSTFDSNLLGGVPIVTAEASRLIESEWSGGLYQADVSETYIKQPVTFIPYYVWANRQVGEMAVWIREESMS
ncbi:glycoside hydrolase family 127 protein [Candidatus Pristimantibacillus sp. PTI5]|uniref:glycoside hydrolase family 127 protein n=1 Tax=Candidatus Pristimantibacillus sp. PTI5 TaxID=3400422 RepID=UPI003B0192AA